MKTLKYVSQSGRLWYLGNSIFAKVEKEIVMEAGEKGTVFDSFVCNHEEYLCVLRWLQTWLRYRDALDVYWAVRCFGNDHSLLLGDLENVVFRNKFSSAVKP